MVLRPQLILFVKGKCKQNFPESPKPNCFEEINNVVVLSA